MQENTQKKVERVSVEDRDVSVDADLGATIDADGLQETLHEIADSFDVTGFKCVKCGLVHQHDTTKHRLSDSFDIDDSDTSDIEYNSVCHCGLQEAARHGDDFGVDEQDARSTASNAPIPPESSKELDEKFGTI